VVIKHGIPQDSVFTGGINPYFLSGDEIFALLKKEMDPLAGLSFSQVHFYGTGCNSVTKETIVKDAIDRFIRVNEIHIGSDLLGAARSLCMDNPGIACIMGTGSNSCFYDGKRIAANVSPLGYILGDEGGGAVLGRKLVSAVLKKQVPADISELFFDTYNITPAEILENVYMKPFPNRFLGQFARFISANISAPELREIVRSSFDEFFRRNVMQYPEAKKYPINFTGSIAYHFGDILNESLEAFRLKPGDITLTPMANLIKFHLKNIYPGKNDW
jgi:N-acetylglucosamine kinase-like BadF-type ATPase